MGKLNEIQEEVKQSYGSNSFTTTVKENTVEFDSAKDSFTFKDAVEVPSLKVNGQEVSGGNANWDANEGEAGYIENKPFYQLPDEEQVFLSGKLDANAQIEGSVDYGKFYFNPPFPFISGETVTFVVEGVETVSWQVQGAPDNSQGGGSGVMTQGGISFSWDTAGIGPDLSKTAFISVSGNPELYGNKNFTFKRIVNGEIKKLDEKFISTPDWNALEGQPGFIKNRPFGLSEGYGYILDKTTSDFVSRFDWDFGNKLIEGEQYRVYRNGSLIKTAYAEKRSDDEIAVTIGTGQLVSYSPTNAFFGNNGQIAGTAGHYQVYGKGIVVVGLASDFIPQLGGVQFKIDGTSLKVSLDSGSTWKTVSIS